MLPPGGEEMESLIHQVVTYTLKHLSSTYCVLDSQQPKQNRALVYSWALETSSNTQGEPRWSQHQ